MTIIKHIELQHRLLLITFNNDWDQDNIASLGQGVFTQLISDSQVNLKIIEHVKGADREYTRFRYQHEYFILHFEQYSNSCWIEPEDQLDNNMLSVMYQQLS